jgi:hypothetical protein
MKKTMRVRITRHHFEGPRCVARPRREEVGRAAAVSSQRSMTNGTSMLIWPSTLVLARPDSLHVEMALQTEVAMHAVVGKIARFNLMRKRAAIAVSSRTRS